MKKFIFVLIGFFVFLKLIYLFKFHLPIWDEAVYIGMGKYIFSAGTSGLWEPLRPIVLPLIYGLFWSLKLPVIKAAELLNIFFAAGTIFLVYHIAARIFGNKTGIIAALLLSFSSVFFLQSSSLMTEIPSTFFVTLSLYLWIQNRFFFAGFVSALAFLTKFPHGLFFIVLLLAAFSQRNRLKYVPLVILGFTAVLIPFFIFNSAMYDGGFFYPFIQGAAHQNNPAESLAAKGFDSPIYELIFYPLALIVQNPIYIFIFIALFSLRKGSILASYFLVYLAYFTIILNKQERFLILFLPAAAILAAYGLANTLRIKANVFMYYPVMLLAVLSIMYSFTSSVETFNQRGWEPTKEVALYSYFERNNIDTAVLISDPVFAAFSDNEFIPFYFSAQEGLDIYNEEKDDVSHIVLAPNHFFCATNQCMHAKVALINQVSSENTLVLSDELYQNEQQYFIFSRP